MVRVIAFCLVFFSQFISLNAQADTWDVSWWSSDFAAQSACNSEAAVVQASGLYVGGDCVNMWPNCCYYVWENTGNYTKIHHDFHVSPTCPAPYSTSEDSECVTYCPPGTTLDTSKNACVGNQNTAETETQCQGDPVMVNNGSLFETESPDYSAAGHFPLSFVRIYHSYNSPNVPTNVTNGQTESKLLLSAAGWTRYVQPAGYTGAPQNTAVYIDSTPRVITDTSTVITPQVPGYGYQLWRNNFDYVLDLTNTSQILLIPPLAGNKVQFTGSSNTLTANDLSGETLTKNTDASGVVTWVYRDRANIIRVFNTSGLLITEQDVSGFQHHLSYDVAKRLIAVADDFGHMLSFSYDTNGRIAEMVTPVGTVTYGYDDKGNLTTVTKVAGADTTTRTYVYDDSRFSYALTGIIDEKGNRYTSWTYDDMGRVTDNHGINSAEKTSLAYTDTTTTVTNPLGKADIYTYATIGGARRLVSVAGQASTSCLAANQNYTYYDNGLLKSKTDWKGNVTAYEYNERGQITKVTEAADSANARVTTTVWHDSLPLPLSVTQDNQTVSYSYDTQGRLTGQQVSGQ
jgi:Rhs family protein